MCVWKRALWILFRFIWFGDSSERHFFQLKPFRRKASARQNRDILSKHFIGSKSQTHRKIISNFDDDVSVPFYVAIYFWLFGFALIFEIDCWLEHAHRIINVQWSELNSSFARSDFVLKRSSSSNRVSCNSLWARMNSTT